MEIFLMATFCLIGAYVLYWVVRMGVRDGIADARDREALDEFEDGLDRD